MVMRMPVRAASTAREIADAAHPLFDPADLDPLLERIGDARFVLLGESSHGTHEFYRWRAELTKRLIAERGFSFVAVEGDWPDCHRIHESVVGTPDAPDPHSALRSFARWPAWMWANDEVSEFTRWLRQHNHERLDALGPAGFHGLDVYSLWDSLDAVLAYLTEHEPDRLEQARDAFRCFEPYRDDISSYGWSGAMVPGHCADEVAAMLVALCNEDQRCPPPAGALTERFVAQQNAVVVANAERYYRTMIRGDATSWNQRDHHMADTLDRLVSVYGPASKAVVWAHNTHVGDARATDMARFGMVNVGQIVRDRHHRDGVVLVGFGTHAGSVIAGPRWGGEPQRMAVPPARDGSVESIVHDALPGADSLFVFPPKAARTPGSWLRYVHKHRAIGVVYDPGHERQSNYVPTVLGDRYDAFLHFDHTSALRPLDLVAEDSGEPTTYPTGV